MSTDQTQPAQDVPDFPRPAADRWEEYDVEAPEGGVRRVGRDISTAAHYLLTKDGWQQTNAGNG